VLSDSARFDEGRAGSDLAPIERRSATRARAGAGEPDVGIFGADIAGRCLSAGLVDEIIVHLVPVLLGDGVRLFDSPGTAPIKPKKIHSDDPGQITDLSYAVVR
jgi:dihydrofolate reductase